MAIVRINFKQRDQLSPDWRDVDAILAELSHDSGGLLYLEDSGGSEMSVYFVSNFGFYVSTCSGTDRERIASDRTLPADRIRVVIADEQEVPRSILIGYELAVTIVRDFFDTGKKSKASDWVDPFEVIA